MLALCCRVTLKPPCWGLAIGVEASPSVWCPKSPGASGSKNKKWETCASPVALRQINQRDPESTIRLARLMLLTTSIVRDNHLVERVHSSCCNDDEFVPVGDSLELSPPHSQSVSVRVTMFGACQRFNNKKRCYHEHNHNSDITANGTGIQSSSGTKFYISTYKGSDNMFLKKKKEKHNNLYGSLSYTPGSPRSYM